MDRKLSGIFVRAQDENMKWQSRDLTDCSETQIRIAMKGRDVEELTNWIVAICKSFKKMGDDCNIEAGPKSMGGNHMKKEPPKKRQVPYRPEDYDGSQEDECPA